MDVSWIDAMQEKINQFEHNKFWNLVHRPNHQSLIGTMLVYRNKLNEDESVIRNKVRLVAQEFK